MRPARLRRALLAATWLAGTALATLIVYEAVGAVALQVTDQSLEPLSQAGVGQALAQPSGLTAPPTATSVASPTTTQPPPTQQAPQTPASGGGGNASGGGVGGGASGGGSAGGGGTPSPPVVASNTRTFTLIGGTANLTCAGTQISLNWATPNSGFEMDTGSSDGGAQIEVRFRNDTHESQLQAWCSGGVVQGSVQEQST